MNKYLLRTMLSVLCMISLLSACDDKEEGGFEMDGVYSNKLSAPEEGNILNLTYDGHVLIGKEIAFKRINNNTANITLQGILPGESATLLEQVTVTPGNNGYSFSGDGIGNNGTTFVYNGTVEKGKMTFNLAHIQIRSNQLTSHGTWYPVQTGVSTAQDPVLGDYTCMHYAFHLVTDNLILKQAAPTLEAMLGNLITWFIRDVTFSPDGTITAHYATMPEGKTVADLIAITPDRTVGDWIISPVNLAFYSVKEDSELYLMLNIDMILYQIQQNRTKANEGLNPAVIAAVYQQLNKWSTTGIKMKFRRHSEAPYNNMGNLIAYKGDLFLFLEKEEIQAFLPLLPLIKELLPEDVLSGPMGTMIGPILDMLSSSLQQAKVLELGLMLTKEKQELQ